MGLLDDRIGGVHMSQKANYSRFYKGKKTSSKGQTIPKGMKANPGKRVPDSTIYHDKDEDRTQWTRGDGHSLPTDFGKDRK